MQSQSIHCGTVLRTVMRVTMWAFCVSFILFIPLLLILIGWHESLQIKDTNGNAAWAHNTIPNNLSHTASANSNKLFRPKVQDSVQRKRKYPLNRQERDVSPHSENYLVMDLATNRLLVKRGVQTLLSAVASGGSGKVLTDPNDPSRWWVFETPTGTFEIQSKLIDPVWIQPDWAFIERGQAVPSDQESRLRPGVLGKYALGFGNGYFIHGALYTNLLGTNHTHGCIQLSDQDLRFVFENIPVGANIIIVS